MPNLVQSIEGMVEAGVKGLVSMAEGYLIPGSEEQEGSTVAATLEEEGVGQDEEGKKVEIPNVSQPTQPLSINPQSSSNPISSAPTSTPNATESQQHITKLTLPKQDKLIQTLDVPSGWIHLQSTYLDGSGEGGQKKVRPFSLKNLVQKEVEIEIDSDLGDQLVFWVGDDDRSKLLVIRDWAMLTPP